MSGSACLLLTQITCLFYIRIFQRPSPLMLAAAHLTMKGHFDVDELLQHLISNTGNNGKTKVRTIIPT